MSGELITGDGQLEFEGYLLGDNDNTFMDAIQGWDDLPPIDSANTLRPASHGAWSGVKLAGQRIITWEGRFAPPIPSWATEIARLKNAFRIPEGSEELELVVKMHDIPGLVFGAVTGRAIPGDRTYGYYGAKLTLQFTCSDPRIYSLGESEWHLSLPPAFVDGLPYPLDYPLDYGVEVQPATGTLHNAGDATTPGLFEFVGPMINPVLVNLTSGARLAFNINLSSGDSLVVDTKNGTVILNGESDRLYTRSLSSSPILSFGLLPGTNAFQLSAREWNTPAGVSITWRDARL